MATTAILPFVHVRGSWGEMGRQVGRMFAPLIGRHVETWIRHMATETGHPREAAVATAWRFAQSIEDHAPFLWEELTGIAQGAEVPLGELMLLQARAEVLRALKVSAAGTPECTTFAVGGRRTEDRAMLFGQNVDLVPFVEEFGVIIRQHPKDAPAALFYTSAGLLGQNGLNEAGVGICANFIDDPGGWGDGLPRYLLSRLALREDSAERALKAVMEPPRAASRNLLIADRGGAAFDAELLCREAAVLTGSDDLLVHANHLEAPQFQGYQTPTENSLCRRERLHALLSEAVEPIGIAHIQRFYRDHTNAPHSVCAHPFPGRNVKTVVSVIGDLARLELHAAKGSPCQNAYATYTLATCREGALSVTVRERWHPTPPPAGGP